MVSTRKRLAGWLAIFLAVIFALPAAFPTAAQAKKKCYLKKVCKYRGKKRKRCYRVKERKCKRKHGRKKCWYRWKTRCYRVRDRKCHYKKVCYRKRR